MPTEPALNLEAVRTALRRADLPADFDSLSYTFIGQFSNDLWRVETSAGFRMILKTLNTGLPQDQSLRTEVAVLKAAAREPALRVPRFIEEYPNSVLMEEVQHQPFSFRAGASAEHQRAAVITLAHWHVHWAGRDPETLGVPDWRDSETAAANARRFDTSWAELRPELHELDPGFTPIGDALVGHGQDTLIAAGESATALHGDAHGENLPLLPGGQQVVMLDWESAHIAAPGFDLAVFTTMSLDVDTRRARERDLVELHSGEVRRLGMRYPDPWHQYRLGILRRAAELIELQRRQTMPSFPWIYERISAAAVDHQVGELIR